MSDRCPDMGRCECGAPLCTTCPTAVFECVYGDTHHCEDCFETCEPCHDTFGGAA